jgi:hypothetical protein
MSRSPQNLYTAEELDLHFQDSKVPSSKTSEIPTPWPSTIHSWPSLPSSHPTPLSPTSSPHLYGTISRITVFNTKAQPFYPPYIYTRTHYDTLRANTGRRVPIFRQIGFRDRKYLFDGWVRIGSVEIVLAQSEELRRFVERKVLVGGLQKERTKEQWESTLGEDWFKVYLEGVESEIGDPMELAEVKEVFKRMSGELDVSLLD